MMPAVLSSLEPLLLALVLAPLLPGIIARTRAVFAGRRGPPFLQAYYDLWKLLRKGAVYSRTTTWVFRAAPSIGLAVAVVAAMIVPGVAGRAIFAFEGDMFLLVYLLALARFGTVTAALDTGSSFEGMGASREVQFALISEMPFVVSLVALACLAGTGSLGGIVTGMGSLTVPETAIPALVLVLLVLMAVALIENCRIPFDDPTTHLELTMIHEVMVLDYGGPDLAFILYAASIKLWLAGTLVVGVALAPCGLSGWSALAAQVLGMALVAVFIGVVESVMARYRLVTIPQIMVGAGALALLAFGLVLRIQL